jgi:hypothetical protein
VAALAAEVERLRAASAPPSVRRDPAQGSAHAHATLARASAVASSFREDEIESLVGRYGTLLLGAFVLLMGVGVLIQLAVAHGLLTPAVRVGIGAIVAGSVGAAGVYFHRRGEVRYANVLLALALALVDLVAWGAGPRLHIVSTAVSFAVVVVAAVALAALALHDGSEFLFSVAVGAALSAPFVTTEWVVAPETLLAYGGAVLLGGVSAVRDPRWERAFVVLVAGALAYALAAVAMPITGGAASPFAVALFGGASALGALLLAQRQWRSGLARAFLAVSLLGVPAAWDLVAATPSVLTWWVALALAAVTYAALWVRRRAALWTPSALALPFVSLGIIAPWSTSRTGEFGVLMLWALFAAAAWQAERVRGEPKRGGAHLTAAALLGTLAIGWLLWPRPLGLVVALCGWSVVAALACRGETRPLPLVGIVVPLAIAALSAMDQLATRRAFAYVPFGTRSSASAASVTVALGLAGAALSLAASAPSRAADRAVRLGTLIGFAILWGRMELAGAWSPDVAAFLLIAYYAGCGLGAILAGRRFAVSRLRLAGLGLAIYAAVKAIAQASDIGELLLRVGAYGAVGVFLLAAGYLYRESGDARGPARVG